MAPRARVDSNKVFTRIWDAFENGEIVIACAWCDRVRLDGAWCRAPLAAAAAIDARLIFSHSICAECAAAYTPQRSRARSRSMTETDVAPAGVEAEAKEAGPTDVGGRPTGREDRCTTDSAPGRMTSEATKERNAMSESTEFTIGSDVACRDGVCGELKRVVVDPVAKALTHLVVEPKHGGGAGRLVPVALVDSTGQEIRLSCSSSEFDRLESAEESEFLPGASDHWGYGQGQILSWPYHGLGMGMGGVGMGGMGLDDVNVGAQTIVRERVPLGEVQVRRGEHVHATDGDIGRVQGLIVDPADHHVTHVLLDEGHLWGKKEVAIPIGAVTSVADGVRLSLSKDEVDALPPVEVDRGE
jgi:sporulation protein YlmC with PRC-barrel domain